jgi:hypothetical protein
MADPEWGSIGFYARMYENGAPVIVSTRLKIYDHQITEIETIVVPERGRMAGAGADAAAGTPPPDYLGDRPRPRYTRIMPPAQRRSREQLMRIVNTYFTGIENNTGDKPPLFSPHCQRIEDGRPTSNVPLAHRDRYDALDTAGA